MGVQEPTLWGIHAGRTGDADTLFQSHGVIALGWDKVPDLTTFGRDREALKARMAQLYPEMKPGAVPVSAGQLFRFHVDIQVGDLVLYPSKRDREIHFGRVTSPYLYDQSHVPTYPHRRKVEWIKSVARTRFSQGSLYEIGSALSLFQVRNYADEFRLAIEGREAPPPVEDDTTVAVVAEEIEETTRDFVRKTLLQELKGHPFADFVAHLLNTMGYRTRISPPGPDGGVDIVAHRDELGFEPPIIKVQVKSSEGNVGNPEVASLYGNIGSDEFGLFVTLGIFTPPAQSFARSKSNLRLIAGDQLVDLVLAHYEQFDSRYKGILPLKRVYIPETLKEE